MFIIIFVFEHIQGGFIKHAHSVKQLCIKYKFDLILRTVEVTYKIIRLKKNVTYHFRFLSV